MAYSKKDAETFLQQVIDKLDVSAKKYNDNAYQVADIPKEIEEELIDIVGWPLLEVLRIREVMAGKLARIEDIYWENFFKRQTTEFLRGLHERVSSEIDKRNFIPEYDVEEERILERALGQAKDFLKDSGIASEEISHKLMHVIYNFRR